MFGYWFKNWSFNYKLGYAIVITGLRTFYKKYEVTGLENIPKDGGVLFAVNHQNAFMDPVVLASQLQQKSYYLVRADIFKKKIAAKILNSMYMLPIYRQRDGVNTVTSNEKTFDKCFDILKKKGYIIIFPEGNHNNQKKIRPLKKGIARIGLGSANKYNFQNNVYIVPVGLNYSNHTNMRATLFINIGKAIPLKKYFSSYVNEPSVTINNVMNKVEGEMKKLTIDIQSSNYDIVHQLILLLNYRINSLSRVDYSLENEFELQQELVKKMETLEAKDPVKFKSLTKNVAYLNSYFKKNNIRSHHLENSDTKKSNLSLTLIFLFITFPIHVYGLLSNYLPYKIPVWFVNKKVKDLRFHSSIKMSLGVTLFFLFWIIQFMLIWSFLGIKIGLIYIITLPIVAWFNNYYWISILKTKGKLSYLKLKKKNALKDIEDRYRKIITTVEDL